ncbi:spindle assembly checkpoint component MAD1 [Gaeumannomyces tritici R3-111a-1]|uniref:Spindle assembly checkpoint component MAD1 n=1 Tax=Gaeumannomyces tritici (strain R3-111a-1) TaxID=644352 RepID=J3PFP3_GAET3|nr:spindle assembly checkpoint component MAD1 [Gaeumannomyces tritici R3-111a-1]EJT70145.1 spindle assembly checkpoint component MAD1 [Gaeumannomyces tritici R3-111a-1]
MARRTRTPRVVSSSTTTMRAHTPQKQHDDGSPGTAQGNSGATRFRASTGVAGPPRPQAWQSRFGSSMRATSSQQPTFNLLTGETSVPSAPGTQLPRRSLSGGRGGHYPTSQRVASRESSKENMAPPDAQEYETQRRRIEELKAEVGALNYRVSAYDQEKEMLRLQHDSELRDARRRAEEDFKLKQAADAERDTARRSAEALQEELDSLRSDGDDKVRALEKRAREAEEEASLLREQLQDLSSARDGEARMAERKTMELRKQAENAQRMATEQAEEAEEREAALAKARTQLAERDATIGQLEADVLRLKAHTGDAETMAVIRRELTDQVQHIRALEATNRDQLTELKRLRQARKAVEVVEEEKRSLQRRLELSADLETELEEERIQRQRLEDERAAWTAYLQNEAVSSDGETELDSPEAVARALVQERLNSASLLEKLGSLEPELGQREEAIRQLEVEKAELSAELEKVKSMPRAEPAGPADKGRLRLERQRALAVKEVEYLRAQLKTFDAEDVAFQPENFDQAKAERVQQLEDLVDKYKAEVQSLHQEMSSLESSATSPAVAAAAGTKRPRESDENHVSSAVQSEQLGQLARKNRKLQEELAALQKSHRLADKELRVAKAQVSTAKESSRVRVLSLRSNPTSDHEAVKASRLRALERENAELLEHVARKGAASSFRTVPLSALDAARREVEDAKAEAASAHKTSKRLKEVWAAKSGEFKEAIFSTLGWTVTFIPNGKMRVESVYHPSESDEHENSIVFDGERGTMKVGGGPRSAFAQRIDDQIRFWVREKGCIPGFLAALTLEFYEEHSKSSRPG